MVDHEKGELLPILGIPGAAHLAEGLALPWRPVAVEVAPGQQHALAVSPEGELVSIDLRGPQPFLHPLGAQVGDASRIAFSPDGQAAAVYDRRRREIQILTDLLGNRLVAKPVDVEKLDGAVSALAISDDADSLLIAVADRTTPSRARAGGASSLFGLTSGGEIRNLGPIGRSPSLCFVPGSHDALAADPERSELLRIANVGGDSSVTVLASARDGLEAPQTVVVDKDLGSAIVALADSNRIALAPISGGPIGFVECSCQPLALARLRGASLYRLTADPRQTVFLLDAGTLGPDGVTIVPRILFVPASSSE